MSFGSMYGPFFNDRGINSPTIADALEKSPETMRGYFFVRLLTM
jgi:hypothetical protein